MAKAATILLAAGVISVFSAPLAVAQHGTLQVCVRNDAHVADDTLDEVRRVVSDIYSQAGLTLLWCADDCTVTIALRPRASNDTARRAPDAMGYTPGGGEKRRRLAFVLINRVNKIADGYGTARSIVLGAAIAHELGHLLISKEHTKTGIMKANWNQSDFRKARQGEVRFTAEQARLIRDPFSVRPEPSANMADSVLGNVVELLRRIDIHPDDVRVTNNRPLNGSPFVEGFIYNGDDTIYLPIYSDTYLKAQHGDRESVIKLASVIAHEMIHVEQYRKGRKLEEMAAYDQQLRVLRQLNASHLTIIRVEKAKSQLATRKAQNPL